MAPTGPFAETVLAWRLERRLTQAELARRAGLPRSNLSAIERGEREVTLRTLRALALALEVRPGVLADGEMPRASLARSTRAALERIAEAAARGLDLADPGEARLARHLRQAMSAQLGSTNRRTRQSRPYRRRADRAYLLLRAGVTPEVLASLVERVINQLGRE